MAMKEGRAVWYKCENCEFEMFTQDDYVEEGLVCPKCEDNELRTRLWGMLKFE